MIFANQEKCQNFDIENKGQGQGVEKWDIHHSTRNDQIHIVHYLKNFSYLASYVYVKAHTRACPPARTHACTHTHTQWDMGDDYRQKQICLNKLAKSKKEVIIYFCNTKYYNRWIIWYMPPTKVIICNSFLIAPTNVLTVNIQNNKYSVKHKPSRHRTITPVQNLRLYAQSN